MITYLAEPPKRITLPPIVVNDTWNGIQLIGPITINSEPPAAALVSAKMSFRRAYTDISPVFTLVSGTPGPAQGQLTILDDDAWTMTVPAQVIPLRTGTWRWDLELIDANGVKKTWIGGTIAVTREVTTS